jgi:DNA-binding NarL/FixJ family response regulator
MAVLSEPVDGTHESGGELCVAVSAGGPEAQDRIATALAGGDLSATLLPIADPGELAELEIDPNAIVVLGCDPDLPENMTALRRARRELDQQAIVIISPAATGTGVRRALDAGADAVVFESELESTLAVAVRAVASGQSVVPRELRASVERPAFSHRERQVLEYVSKGLTNAQIAEQLFLSESTIKSHLSSAFAKFGVRSRKEAAALFLELQAATAAAATQREYLLSQPTPRGANA